MLRILWSSCDSDSTNSQQKVLRRTEGGWWYSEETEADGQDRKAWEVHSRIPCDDGICEVLTALPEDWIQQPCWQDEPLQQVQILREQGLISLQKVTVTEEGQEQQRQLLSLWLPLEQEWPQWVQELLGVYKHTLAQHIAKTRRSASPSQGPVYPSPQKQPGLTPKAEHPLRTPAQRQSLRDRPHAGPQEGYRPSPQGDRSKPSQEHRVQPSVSGVPKGLQTGALLKPVDLPIGQLPRNSNDRRPAHRGRPGRDRRPQPPVCLLVEE